VSKALGIAILRFAGRNAADQGHDVASDVGIEVLIEHPDNLATPSTIRFTEGAARGGAADGLRDVAQGVRLRRRRRAALRDRLPVGELA
jgi:hypothetical protein